MTNEISLNILAVGYHQEIMQVLKRLMNNHAGWKGTIALSMPEALDMLHTQQFDALLLCAGVSDEDEQALQHVLTTKQADTKLIRHYGGGSGLLENEIRTAFENYESK